LALASAGAVAADTEKLTGESRVFARDLAGRLGAELKKEISAGGPESAIKICKSLAPEIAGEISTKTGWRVTRVSLKPRNAMLGAADAWEQQVLESFDRRAAKGEDPEKLEIGEIVIEPQGTYFRYMKALPVQPLCLNCHGAGEVKDGVRARLATEYPHDKATGYSAGQIRGAISIKRTL
jgi:hypothetical protein